VSGVEVRPAGAGDAAPVARLLGQLGYPSSGTDVAKRVARIGELEDAGVLVAEAGGSVVGVAAWAILPMLERPAPRCRLLTLVVDEALRRRGVASALVQAVERLAHQAGCGTLEVTSSPERSWAHAFYRRHGFRESPQRFLKAL
jgi:GNAT superfamily N-acetyltransferase